MWCHTVKDILNGSHERTWTDFVRLWKHIFIFVNNVQNPDKVNSPLYVPFKYNTLIGRNCTSIGIANDKKKTYGPVSAVLPETLTLLFSIWWSWSYFKCFNGVVGGRRWAVSKIISATNARNTILSDIKNMSFHFLFQHSEMKRLFVFGLKVPQLLTHYLYITLGGERTCFSSCFQTESLMKQITYLLKLLR